MRSTNKIFFYTPLFLQTAIWPATRFLFWFFLRWKIVGLENLKNLSPGVIFVSNHTSELDAILVPASLPFLSRFMPMFYVSRPKGFYNNSGWRQIFYGGFFFKLWGAHSAISGYKDYGVSLSPHIHLVQHRRTVLIFPEGRKTLTGKVMVEEARGGVAFLAEKTGLPIVPIYINGAYNLTLKDFFWRRRHVSIVFGKPIYAKELFTDAQIAGGGDNNFKAAARKLLGEVANLAEEAEAHAEASKHEHSIFIRAAYFFIRKVFGPVVRAIWIKKVEGLENVPIEGPAIVAFNHQSYFDFICFIAVSPRNIHFLSAEKFFKHPLWLPLMKVTGQIKVERESHDKQELHKTVLSHLKNGKMIGIFPEGTRSPDRHQMLRAFTGVAKYAVRAGAPVVPVGLVGTYDVMAKGDKKPKFKKLVTIKIGAPIRFESHDHSGKAELSAEDYRSLTDKVMLVISLLSGKIYSHAGK